MEPADRLTAYVAGELSADERLALEAELARDAGLRADLAALQRADEALRGEAATELPAGARDRLLAALEPTLAAELGDRIGLEDRADATDRAEDGATPASDLRGASWSAAGAPATDELAARRRAANRRSWITGLGGVAAAIAAIAIIGPTIGGLGGASDSAGGDAVTTMDAESGGEAADAPAADEGAATSASPVGPTLLGSARTLDEDAAAELLTAGELQAVVAQQLSVDDGLALGSSWALAFGVEPQPYAATDMLDATADDGEEAAADADVATEGRLEAEDDAATAESRAHRQVPSPDAARELGGAADLQLLGDVDEDARADVSRCLDTVLAAGGVVVPALAELVTFGGEPAIAYALVGVAPDQTLTRPEVWVLARESCETRYLRQG